VPAFIPTSPLHKGGRFAAYAEAQTWRISVKFELPGNEAILRREGDGLVIEPLPKRRLLDLLATWEPLEDEFPEIADEPVKPEDVF
jgi:antitoxin VapB